MFNYPFYYKRPFPIMHKAVNNNNISNNKMASAIPQFKMETVLEEETNYTQKEKPNNQDFLFELFGLKIYSDDILIIVLLYLLYSEEVKDDFLFIILFLLLIG